MAKAKNKEEYIKYWDEHMKEVLYGPCRATNIHKRSKRMHNAVTKLRLYIEEVAVELDNDGVFKQE